MSGGALAGITVIEFAGLGPCPFAGMMLADMGADVLVIHRIDDAASGERADEHRGKRSIALDLKHERAREVVWALLERADALIEGFRPGVMERLGYGPDAVAARCPKLVYGRVTGWGQTGPLAQAAGHDINYVSLTGAMSIAGRQSEAPMVPATLVGDMGGGAMFLAFGTVCALLESQRSGRGQVVDAAMVDGVSMLASLVHQRRGNGHWSDDPKDNFFLGASPFYDVFECADGGHVSLGPIEPKFYAELLQRLELTDVDPARQYAFDDWPALRERIAALLKTRPRAHWCARLEGSDACFAPVLSLAEAPHHPHHVARGAFVEVDGRTWPAPAPRLSRSAARAPQRGPAPGEHTDAVLRELGFDAAALRAARACA
ncbi:MAG TPA: CaiB/BaiF CoA-transferase family protein [Burkholderiaceae bacterium]|nr:CaiB/BaiF CoA-transferase family protein [Burkholderiaceae bacterium]